MSPECIYPCFRAVRKDREHPLAQLGLGHSPRSRSPLRHTHVTQELGKVITQPNLLLGPSAGGEEGLRGCGADRVASCSATTCSIYCVLDLSIRLLSFSCPQKGFTHVVTRPLCAPHGLSKSVSATWAARPRWRSRPLALIHMLTMSPQNVVTQTWPPWAPAPAHTSLSAFGEQTAFRHVRAPPRP